MEIKDRIAKLTEQLPNVIVGKIVQQVLKMNLPEKAFLEEMERRLTEVLSE